MRVQIVIDDDLGEKLNKLQNKSEYIRQAIIEKLARDKSSNSDNAESKEFLELMKSLQKTMSGNNELLLNIQQKVMSHESKTMKSHIKNKESFSDLMREVYKINICAAQAAGNDFITENRDGIQIEAERKLKIFMEKYDE